MSLEKAGRKINELKDEITDLARMIVDALEGDGRVDLGEAFDIGGAGIGLALRVQILIRTLKDDQEYAKDMLYFLEHSDWKLPDT